MKKILSVAFVLLSALAVHAQDGVETLAPAVVTTGGTSSSFPEVKHALSPLESCQVDAHQQKSNALALQIENAQLRAALADAQAKLDGPALTASRDALLKERTGLEKVLLKALGGKDGDAIDWTTSPPTLKTTSPR